MCEGFVIEMNLAGSRKGKKGQHGRNNQSEGGKGGEVKEVGDGPDHRRSYCQ